MKCQWILVSSLLAAVCGLAFSQGPAVKTPLGRLDALEKEVASLRAEVTALRQAAPGQGGDPVAALKLASDLKDTRALVEQLAAYARAQAQSASELERVLDESEQKGFTYGINPDSRTVLLAGWRAFAGSLQENVPVTPPPAPAPAVRIVR